MFKRIMKILLVLIILFLLIQFIMILDTRELMSEVKDVFNLKINENLTEGRALNLYNRSESYKENIELGEVKLNLIRLFTWHNFKQGYIYVYYTRKILNKNREVVAGSANIYSKWEIRKENGRWDIVKIYEAP